MSTSTSTANPAAGRAAWQPRTAFVLAGGAALGAMQAGMIHALYERGITPDLLIGTSAGALNAAFLASRPATTATAEELAALWRGLRRSDILPLRPATLVSGLAGRRDHLIPDQALRRLAARHLQFEQLEQAAIPLHLVAFDLLAGTEVRLSDGGATRDRYRAPRAAPALAAAAGEPHRPARAALAPPILLAAALNAAAVAGLAGIAGFHAVYASLTRIQGPWLGAVPASLATSAIGYYLAYRSIYAAEGGYKLSRRQLTAVVAARPARCVR